MGHLNIQTTRGYVAVFDEDVIRHYQAHLHQRRRVRPTGEYWDATNEEWTEFEEHFDRREVELGSCGRPYGTLCQHEYACVRCLMLRVEPAQRRRLEEIIRNFGARIDETRANGWLGEVQGLQVSLEAARGKLASLDRLARNRARPREPGDADHLRKSRDWVGSQPDSFAASCSPSNWRPTTRSRWSIASPAAWSCNTGKAAGVWST